MAKIILIVSTWWNWEKSVFSHSGAFRKNFYHVVIKFFHSVMLNSLNLRGKL